MRGRLKRCNKCSLTSENGRSNSNTLHDVFILRLGSKSVSHISQSHHICQHGKITSRQCGSILSRYHAKKRVVLMMNHKQC